MLKEIINGNQKILVFSGAGVSTESGLPDFRGNQGLYKKSVDPIKLLSRDTYQKNPKDTIGYILDNFIIDESIIPNKAHYLPVKLDAQGKLLGVVTQNVDGLYQRAGLSEHKLVEIHGNADIFYCQSCGKQLNHKEVERDSCHSLCCDAKVDTDVVLYGDNFDEGRFYQYQRWIKEADLIIVMGTSLNIQAHLMSIRSHPNVILINNEDIDYGYIDFKQKFIGNINTFLD